MQLQISAHDLLEFDGGGIVVPSNSVGQLNEGIAARIKEVVGQRIEDAVVSHIPIAVGAALVTECAPLPATYAIHVPLTEEPGMRIGVENIRRATRAALLAAEHHTMDRVAIPAMGFGEIGVSHEESARAMVDEVNGFKCEFPRCVVFVTQDSEMLAALRALIKIK